MHNSWNISHICLLVVSHKRLLKKPLVGNSTNLLAFAALKEGHLFFLNSNLNQLATHNTSYLANGCFALRLCFAELLARGSGAQ